LPETGGDEAATVAERIRAAVETERFTPQKDGDPVTISISIGVTEYNLQEEIAVFVQRADKAMYQSKQAGRNRVSCLFTSKT